MGLLFNLLCIISEDYLESESQESSFLSRQPDHSPAFIVLSQSGFYHRPVIGRGRYLRQACQVQRVFLLLHNPGLLHDMYLRSHSRNSGQRATDPVRY